MFSSARLLLLFAAALAAQTPSGKAAGTRPVDFNREIRPILSDQCFTCHGPDEKQRMMNLRLDTRDGAFAQRPGGAVIVPGDSAASKLYQRIAADKPALKMPPAHTGRSLTAEQVALFKRWIDEGAKWEMHWSYVAPQRPEPPAVKRSSWVRNPIDRFILARLEREGLRPSPPADRATLLRRVTLDLTGLPPTPAELAAFLRDRSPQAYEKVVDRLLGSPQYGEKMALHWLDIARYADTHGYHIDSHRDMWPWRDWVIHAFNSNQPYDQFVLEQLAGDLLPAPTRDQRIATGFNRNHMINFEGGAIAEEYRTEYVIDRMETTATAFLGMTIGCARCHDHKYDPISQRDFYRFFAFYNTVPEKGLDGRIGNAAPTIRVSSLGQEIELDKLSCELREKQDAFPEAEAKRQQAEWELERRANPVPEVKDGITAHFRFDDNLEDSSGSYHRSRAVEGEIGYVAAQIGRGAGFDTKDRLVLGGAGAEIDRGKPFSVALWIRPGGEKGVTILRKLDAARRGFAISTEDSYHIPDLKRGARVHFRFGSASGALHARTREPIFFDTWTHVVANYDGGKLAAFVDGKPAELDLLEDALRESFQHEQPLEIAEYRGSLDDLRIFRRTLTGEEVERLATHMPADTLVAAGEKRSRDEQARLREYFLTHAAPSPLRERHAEIAKLKRREEAFLRQIPTTMVMQEMDEPRKTFILKRGQYDAPGEEVTAGVPSILPQLPEGEPANRMALAKWFTDPSHPLTARVAVNRFWQTYFGTGLVKTAEDFGSQGEPPSHPELLDWLATEFIRTGWDVKAMQRLIVTSAAYRQSSAATPALLERDPENRLIARMSRFRLPAEIVRDNALAASGLLSRDIGGPSVSPYQPPGLWEEMAFHGVYSAQTYKQSTGSDLYRRSMYTFWKRTVPPASLSTFDAPDREKCAARRPVTNTPLQALVLLNDPTYVEAARALAQRVLREARPDLNSRIAHAFQLVTLRKPSGKQALVLRSLARRQLDHYAANRDAAVKLLSVGESKPDPSLDSEELAAWTAVSSVLLAMDETITKE